MKGETATEALGILYGVGVGPGDPGLVTLRAAEVIRKVDTIAYPIHKMGAGSRALETVREQVPPATGLLPLLMPMTRDRQRLAAAHSTAAGAITAAARKGRDVAYLSLGDPLFYSTFGYLAELFPGEVRTVSGVTAMSAAAAALGLPLAAGDATLAVVTGVSEEALKSALALGGSVVIMKPRSLSAAALDRLEESGALDRTAAAIELGSGEQRIIRQLNREAAAGLPYFSILWIKPA